MNIQAQIDANAIRAAKRAKDSVSQSALAISTRNHEIFGAVLAQFINSRDDETIRFANFNMREVSESVLQQSAFVDLCVYQSMLTKKFVVSFTHLIEYCYGATAPYLSNISAQYVFASRSEATAMLSALLSCGDDDV